MRKLQIEPTVKILNRIMEAELSGVVRFTHYSLMVTGPHRIPIVGFFKEQATESLAHAQQVGEILTSLEGHPTVGIQAIEETHEHSIRFLLEESLQHEENALALYAELLDAVKDASVYLEEFARGQIAQEELHVFELRKMVRDYGKRATRPPTVV